MRRGGAGWTASGCLPVHGMERPPERPGGRRCGAGSVLDRVADGAQDLADLPAQEDEGDDRDDRDEGEDQRVLREALALLLVTREERRDECVEVLHLVNHLLSRQECRGRAADRPRKYGYGARVSILRTAHRCMYAKAESTVEPAPAAVQAVGVPSPLSSCPSGESCGHL